MRMMKRLLLALFLMAASGARFAIAAEGAENAAPATVHVSFWFDTEDYILPASDDAAKRLAEIFTAQGVHATFKVVGEKARVLRERGRDDVIAALAKHDIAYHTDFHSVHPTPSEYERDLGWDEGVEEFIRREGRGYEDVRRIFGMMPSCYGQPGSSWAPQSYGALRIMRIPVYLDDTSHIGLDGRPFWYGGILNALNLRGYTTRSGLDSEQDVEEGCKRFEEIRRRAEREGGGLISIYYHPCEWVHKQFWDGVNFAKGANPPRSQWKKPPQKDPEVTERWFANFAKYLEYCRTRPNVRLVTGREIAALYPDRAYRQPFNRDEVAALARGIAREVTFARVGDRAVSPAEIASVLAQAAVRLDRLGRLPASVRPRFFYGPEAAPVEAVREGEFEWPRWAEACRDFLDATERIGRMPPVVWVAGKAVDPVDFAATLGEVIASAAERGKAPETVRLVKGNFTVAKYVAEDSPRLWGWVIFPDNFRAPKMMALAKLQSWTLKPAILAPLKP